MRKKLNVERAKITGVTVLTSIDKEILNNQMKISGEAEEQVLSLAKLAHGGGLACM
ncbi:hypothetical protein IIA94_00545 [Patescibacteria group bacterium]|nr:hypothetical protein [Patescibacteria group bacterium]